MSEASNPKEKEIAAHLRLRGDPPRATRLSRKVLVALGAASSVAIVAAVAFAMTDRPGRDGPGELYNVGGPPPERLTSLPKDYGAPRLGPPLPGDLGGPIVSAQTEGAAVQPPPIGGPTAASTEADQARQRLVQERDSARTSRLFAAEAQATAPSALDVAGPTLAMLSDGAPQTGRTTILDGPVDRRTTSPDRLQAPASPYIVQAGATIPAALVTGLRSDLPGQVIGQVTQNVYDSPTGRFLLIPQGSRLIGAYDSQIAFGQSRVLLAWTRLILPNGRSIVLEKVPAADAQGYAGLQDSVDRHWRALFGTAALATLLGVGTEIDAGNDESDLVRALRRAGADTFNQVGQQAVGRGLSIPPTLTIRPGMLVRVMVTRDLVLEPYRN